MTSWLPKKLCSNRSGGKKVTQLRKQRPYLAVARTGSKTPNWQLAVIASNPVNGYSQLEAFESE
ncbi:hypothetical protein DP113_05455 [Brasilonema octagenarum UFV-E1]|uniref:Transposase n=1 Tax=Brasilonema octagenarum UFV-OR1 TaxID=417115 RepID=A0ABX1MES4_9CYAN|nr:hypothetical protein [Brasilonema sennae]NMF65289.1 hypothetical protein [Brasilonema octagenarum UFV-OR1]QDL13785.1 hypothetical protein DP113_05455 [Brasilonema octagenarum UFV-E1]